MLLNLNFIPGIIQKVCVFVCLFISLLLIHFFIYHCKIQHFSAKEKLSIHFRTNGENSCSVLRCWANDGPTLNCQQTTDEKLLPQYNDGPTLAQRIISNANVCRSYQPIPNVGPTYVCYLGYDCEHISYTTYYLENVKK